MNFWKWSLGEAYYKSARPQNHKTNSTNDDFEYDSSKQAINMSLNDNEGIVSYDEDLINITNTMFSRNQNISSTRREDLDNKMSDRDLIVQRGINPFSSSSYVNDVVTRDMFLKPINTTQGTNKVSNTSTN